MSRELIYYFNLENRVAKSNRGLCCREKLEKLPLRYDSILSNDFSVTWEQPLIIMYFMNVFSRPISTITIIPFIITSLIVRQFDKLYEMENEIDYGRWLIIKKRDR